MSKRNIKKQCPVPVHSSFSDTLITSEVKPILKFEDFHPQDSEITSLISYKFIYPKDELFFEDPSKIKLEDLKFTLEPVILNSYPTAGIYCLPGEVTFNKNKKFNGYALYFGPKKEIIDFHVFLPGEKRLSVINDIPALESKGIFIKPSVFKYEVCLDKSHVQENNLLNRIISFSEIKDNYININDVFRIIDSSAENSLKTGVDVLQLERLVNGHLINDDYGIYLVPSIVRFNNGSILLCLVEILKDGAKFNEGDIYLLTNIGLHSIQVLKKMKFIKKNFLPIAIYSQSLVAPGSTDLFEPQIMKENKLLTNHISNKLYKIKKNEPSKYFSNQLLLPLDLSLKYFDTKWHSKKLDRPIKIVPQKRNMDRIIYHKGTVTYRLARVKLKNNMSFWGMMTYNPLGVLVDVSVLKYRGLNSILFDNIVISGVTLNSSDIFPLNIEPAFAIPNGDSFKLEFEKWREIPNNNLAEYRKENFKLLDKNNLVLWRF